MRLNDVIGRRDRIIGGLVSRTTNDGNQLTAIGANNLAYDNNGNLTTDDHGYTLKYDAWNRLVCVSNGGTTLSTYAFDGAGRRITANNGTASELYYSGTQIVEVRQGGAVAEQDVWSPVYVNALVARDTFAGGTFSERLYMTADANFNVTGVFNTSGSAQQFMVYDSYGNVAFANPDWTPGSNAKSITVLFQGMRRDFTVGLDFTATRPYSWTMARFIGMDPSGYPDGLNAEWAFAANPINRVDPSGKELVISDPATNITIRNDSTKETKTMTRAEAAELLLNQLAPEGKWVVDGKTGVVSSGVNEFCQNADRPNRYASTKFPYSNTLVSLLVNHAKKVTIVLTNGSDPVTAALDPVNAGYQEPPKPTGAQPTGSNSQININMNERVQFNIDGTWQESPLFIVVAHEMRHGLEFAQGSAKDAGGGMLDEFFALFGERVIEGEHHVFIRPEGPDTPKNSRVLLLDTNTFKVYRGE